MLKRMVTVAVLGCMFAVAWAESASAQYGRTKSKPDASQEAMAVQTIGVDSKITIRYHRPGVKDREIWGTRLANYGTPPWRAGANETTSITFSDDVKINGQDLAAGTYGFHILLGEDEWVLIFNSEYKTWGSYQYKEENDVLRVTVTPEDAPHQEWLTFGFEDLAAYSCTAYLHWEKKKASFEVELAEKE